MSQTLRRNLLIVAFLLPPFLWLAVVYLGALGNLLAFSFYRIDGFSGALIKEFGFSNFIELMAPAYRDVAIRTGTMAIAVTLASIVIAFPLAWYMAKFARGWVRFLLFFGVMVPLWSSYLVKLYTWKMLLAKEGIINYLAIHLHMTWFIDWLLGLPSIGGNSLSFSPIGTFLVFLYMWLPYMILPLATALERIPNSLLESATDLGATKLQRFRTVIFPLAMPGIAAGSIFTFSLTLGDYIIPQVIGNSKLFIGNVIYEQQGVSGNIPFAATYTLIPIVLVIAYLIIAKRMGAFNVQ